MDTAMMQTAAEGSWEALQARLKQLERRDGWLRGASVAVMFLLTAAVVASALPTLLKEETNVWDTLLDLSITQGIRGLVGLVLLFNIHWIYQQILIKRLRRGLADQMTAGVLPIVDVHDALTTERPYKRAMSPDPALETMEEEIKKG
ncbi:MAG TPA: hypothetical protein VGQ11_10245 [Candidatus Acidoferrales bacterium]|jgi:hypothetical protein|nr:hypothetical protein [Candidatus Acidoferrales bacterium]